MPAFDFIHTPVRNALIKDGWTITADPYTVRHENLKVFADIAAERVLAAERGTEKIAVEIKTFAGRSPITEFEKALGQYLLYASVMEDAEPERIVYLAIRDVVYAEFFHQNSIQKLLRRYNVLLMIVNMEEEEISEWIRQWNTGK